MDRTIRITPFWNRIPHFFLYGFHPYVLILAGVLLVTSYLIGGALLNFLFYVVSVKYAAEALQHTMDGELTPPVLNMQIINDNYQLPFKLFVVFLCYFFFIGFLTSSDSLFITVPVYIIGQLLIPAVTISLVVTEEIGYSLNPANWFKIAFSIGWPYLIMVLFLFLFNIIDYEFTDLVATNFPGNLIAPILLALNTYFMVVAFHLMGYVVMQYHEELGGDTPTALNEDESSAKTYTHTTPLLERFIEEGNVAAAIAELSSLIEQEPQDIELQRRMYVYLRSNAQHDTLQTYTPEYFSMLCQQQRFVDAANVYLESMQRGEAFNPTTPEHYLPVLRELRRKRANKQAVLLAQGFHKRFPENQHTPELYLEMAKVLSEDLQRDDLAQQALHFVLKSFSGHSLIPQVKQYLEVVTALQSTASPGASA